MYAENNASPDLRDSFYLASIKDMLKDTKEACNVCVIIKKQLQQQVQATRCVLDAS